MLQKCQPAVRLVRVEGGEEEQNWEEEEQTWPGLGRLSIGSHCWILNPCVELGSTTWAAAVSTSKTVGRGVPLQEPGLSSGEGDDCPCSLRNLPKEYLRNPWESSHGCCGSHKM